MCFVKTFSAAVITVPDTTRTRSYYARAYEKITIGLGRFVQACLQIQRSRVRFPALPDFLSSSGSGTGSTQPPEVN